MCTTITKTLKLAVILCLLSTTLGLGAQSYQTAFSEVSVDQIKTAFSRGKQYRIDASSGALNLNIPIGPGIGAGGVHFTPTITGHILQQIERVKTIFDTNCGGISVLPTCESILPGYLDLQTTTEWGKLYITQYEIFNGINGTGSAIPDPSQVSLEALIDAAGLTKAFGYPTMTNDLPRPLPPLPYRSLGRSPESA